jgi:hypothetical protein
MATCARVTRLRPPGGGERRRRAQGAIAGRKARADGWTYLRPLSAAATPSRGEAGEAPIALPKLNGPAPRHVPRWSTFLRLIARM